MDDRERWRPEKMLKTINILSKKKNVKDKKYKKELLKVNFYLCVKCMRIFR